MTAMETDNTLLTTLGSTPADTPDWLTGLQQQGRAHFEAVGLPTRRDEDWREINLAGLSKLTFADATGSVAADELSPYHFPGLDAALVVCVDGRYDASLSDLGELPQGVIVSTLRDAVASHPELVQKHLAKHAAADSDAFTGFNTAQLLTNGNDGLFVYVPQDVTVERAIHLLYVTTDSPTPTVSHPRTLYVVEADAKADVIEQHVGLGENVYFSNAVTEVVVGDRANASHTFVERESKQAYNVSTLATWQGTESEFTSHSLLFGGKIVRNNCRPTIAGEEALSTLNGLYMPDDNRVVDNYMYVHHTHPNCESRQYFAGILRGQGKGVFSGRIKVERPAQKTDAVQSSKNLILSDDAQAHNRPQLEIFADDVKCTHGSTTGEIDEPSVFYLRSRGVPADVAEAMLVFAFANESLERIELEPVRQHLSHLLVKELALGDAVVGLID